MGQKAFRLKAQPTAALIDAVMVGISKRLQSGPILKKASLKSAFSALLKDEKFITVITTSTSDEENVKQRFDKAINVFSDVE